ncbi:serine carboxypeptidase [Alteromonas sp. SM 2104]|nr:serine carboxypeptidase [Alteromonas oceanisediminis]
MAVNTAQLAWAEGTSDTESASKDIPPPSVFVSQHKARFNGESINYKAVAGETYLTDLKGQHKASIFTFSYLKDDDKDPSHRPVTFVWNGGPGSASTWLHMGGFGPKRIVVPSDASHAGLPPYDIKDVPETILDVTDLVFIDPVGTGFSRALGDYTGKDFWGLYEDAESMADFIQTWLTDNKRWNSPRFIMGESYGTTRAAAVANILESDRSISVNGLLFISQALDYQGSTPYVRDNIVSHITYLPTMAATALYHQKVAPQTSKAEFLQAARAFSTDQLLPALFKGSAISDSEYDAVKQGLVKFTGLSETYIDRANIRIQGFRFAKELLRDQGLAVGLLDSRYTRDEIDDLGADDAGSNAISAAYKSALMMHMQSNLGVDWSRHYLSPADPDLSPNWRYRTTPDGSGYEPKYVNTAHDLSKAMRVNPALQVFVASGYYDLVTPFFDAEYTLGRHDIPKQRVTYKYYDGGHMMYVNEEARLALLNDTRAFIIELTR